MRDFFRDWRRKAGVVALLVACLLAGGWARSYVIEDEFWLPNHAQTHFDLILVSHTGIHWSSWELRTRNPMRSAKWQSFPIHGRSKFDNFYSFRRTLEDVRQLGIVRERQTPLWPFAMLAVLLPTIIAAYLIVVPPRTRTCRC